MVAVTGVMGAFGAVVALVILAATAAEIAGGNRDGDALLVSGGLVALIAVPSALGWRYGAVAIRWAAMVSWVLVAAFVGGGLLAVALQDVSAELPNALWIALIYGGWAIVPALCAPVFLGWIGARTRARSTGRRG